ncbi:helix-turn-helix domain-containing protein [Streptomyces sp. TRM66268-LWL]|uniref:Helix-turn-helix domain-containing protein n=1 Tax=Streptomyces polyasparticus TaxID=2767826 RepID=A0ABR7SL98_9ACTN|nr:helix-turn-helix transcriptional regulator [Streptomyces polyasparticus]MBC9716089.1 helix-turn-helix domain-containing protein [Streptomyces polyasparticus]
MVNVDAGRRPERPAEVDGTAHLFRALGRQIKVLREAAGLHQKELAASVHVGEDLVSAIERGVRTPQPDFLERVDEVLGAGGVLRAAIPDVREALKKARTRHPEWYRGYAELEAEAVELHFYANQGVPGLLQIAEYAHTIFSHWRPLLDEGTVEKRVADRLARQQVFERRPMPPISYVLEEVVLDRPIGGRAVWQAQLRRILEVGRMRNVEIQVMPTSREEHPNMDGAFNLLIPKGQHHQIAYTEAQGYPRLITDPGEVRMIADRYGIMRAKALTPGESTALIAKKLGER